MIIDNIKRDNNSHCIVTSFNSSVSINNDQTIDSELYMNRNPDL